MKFIADLHLHSKYSRATSKDMDLAEIERWAQIKGVRVVGTGDFTHPEWFSHLKGNLEPAEAGLFKLKNKKESKIRFCLSTEVSCVYSKEGKLRKVHHIILAPSFKAVEKINTQLSWIGNLKADGRPILGTDSKEILKIVLEAGEDCLLVPGHIWTPWFSIFGSRSGFDSVEECFGEYSKYIYALETGLSSNPAMNWRLSQLDKFTLVSFSDAHSPRKLGREATVFETELSYSGIIEAIKTKDPKKLLYTIEFFPEEGKYHYDGHRNCQLRLSPKETREYNGICPSCKRPVTIGVLSRVEKLADRPENFAPEKAIPFKSLIPLEEIIADALGQTVGATQITEEYNNLIEKLGSELKILIESPEEEIKKATLPEISEGILRVREKKINVEPGYDGVYGKIRIFSEKEKERSFKQKTLFQF
jgi:uncharacterized protein (TIGR00375 family)